MFYKKAILMLLAASVFSASASAADDIQQAKVQDYCGKVSSIILQAAADYNHQLSNAVKPDDAKISVIQQVKDSDDYLRASPAVKAEMDKAVNKSTDNVEYEKMMKEQEEIHERYVGVHAWTWAYLNTTPFIAWCNYNHISG